MEATAQSVLAAYYLGNLVHISDSEVEEINVAFGLKSQRSDYSVLMHKLYITFPQRPDKASHRIDYYLLIRFIT